MEQKTPLGNPERQRTSVTSWLGLGISLVVLLIIWIAIICVYCGVLTDSYQSFYLFLEISVYVCIPLGIIGLICSIIGFYQAIRNRTPKRVGVFGIAACWLSVISAFVLVFIIATNTLKPRELGLTITESTIIEEENPADRNEVLLCLTDDKTIECYDHRHGIDTTPDTIKIDDNDLTDSLASWAKANGIDADTPFALAADQKALMSDVVKVLDFFEETGIKKYRIVNSSDIEADTIPR